MSTTQRDVFISDLFDLAVHDKDVYLISVDMGAPALDRWREELPNQFMSAGISEQHAINFAAGLASEGKKVYVYFMAAWAARCFEQVRYSCAMAGNPITILGNGVGLGYAPAGPAHEPNDDIAYMRSLHNIEIHCPLNLNVVRKLVKLTYDDPKLRYIRLERKYVVELDHLYADLGAGGELGSYRKIVERDKASVAIISSGYLQGRVNRASHELVKEGILTDIYDISSPKPLDSPGLAAALSGYTHIITVEEQGLSGGLGSVVCETLADNLVQTKVLRLGLPDRYIFENGSRDYHLDNEGLSVESIKEKIITFLEK